ncbi:serine/threonine protein kinase [Catenulispora sp. GP43]|uniref:serine/threonine-protein kinase n=1 Tax=Catenulispora sp. GP43 TaxID=3156263 RepID=UPI0035153AA4
MNADPAEGQPTTVPETTAPESTPPEKSTPETETKTAGADASEPDASTDGSTEAEATEPDASTDAPEIGESEAAGPEASEPETAEAEAQGGEAEATEAQGGEAESEADEAPALETEADEAEETPAPALEAPALEAPAAEAEASEPEAAEVEAASDESPAAEAVEPEAVEVPAFEADPEPDPTFPKSASTTPLVAGRYRLVAEIGGGAMGVVWRARDEVLGRDVAVKELRPDHGMSGAQVRTSHQRARREGRIAARLQHPNAVVIYDVAEHDGRPYLIMEYVPSQSLGDILATGAVLTPAEVTSIGAQLASALTAAHERGIVHRDIKPGNVLMTSDGTVKLTDFGISRAAGDATVTATGEILGTPAYTAPEVAQGHPVAFPADVFSLGATLYAAVEGTPPFGEDVNAMALLLRVVRNEIRSPKRSGPLTDTVMWMLSPEPADRPTMKQVWQGLDRLSAKPLPPIGIRPLTPETKAFAAPAPTIVVPEAGAAKSGTITPQPASEPLPASVTPPPMSAPVPITAPTPTPRSISSRVTPPTVEPASTPTSKSSPIAATPTSSMPSATSTRNTRNTPVPAAAAAEPPASTPPPASKSPAASPASPPPAKRSRMPLAIVVCVVGTAVLIVAIVVAMNSGSHDSPNQPVAHGSTASTPSSPAHSRTTNGPSTAPSSSGAANPAPPTTASSTTSSTAPSSTAPSSTPSTTASTSTLASDPVTFVSNYYALLPGNLDAAWPQMTSAYQTNVAGGRSGYDSFWNGIQQVTLSDVSATGPSTVVATIHYVEKNGTSSTERTTFGLVKNGTSWQINTSHTG